MSDSSDSDGDLMMAGGRPRDYDDEDEDEDEGMFDSEIEDDFMFMPYDFGPSDVYDGSDIDVGLGYGLGMGAGARAGYGSGLGTGLRNSTLCRKPLPFGLNCLAMYPTHGVDRALRRNQAILPALLRANGGDVASMHDTTYILRWKPVPTEAPVQAPGAGGEGRDARSRAQSPDQTSEQLLELLAELHDACHGGQVDGSAFVNQRVAACVNWQMQDCVDIVTGNVPEWTHDLAARFPPLLPIRTRKLLVRAVLTGLPRAVAYVRER